jgi:CHAD domain-containing protein
VGTATKRNATGNDLQLMSLLEEGRPARAPGARPGARADRLALPAGVSLATGLAAAMRAMVARAGTMARRAAQQPAEAVHEWRKALRRARALLRLGRPVLPDDARKAIAASLRDAQRAASSLRDADVLLPVLRQLGREPGLSRGARAELARLRSRLALGRRRTRRHGHAAGTLGTHVPRIEAAADRYQRALPRGLARADLARGLARSHRRAARAHRRARRGGDAPAFHDLRKAIKTLHYQAELMASTGSRPAEKLRKRLADLAEAQGAVTDLMLVRAELAAATPRRAHDGRPPHALDPVLDRLIARRRKPADRAAKQLFRISGAAFGKRLLSGIPSK